MIREGVTQGYHLSMVFYGITLAPLAEELRVADLGLLFPLYAEYAALNGSAQWSAQFLKMLVERGPDGGYLTKPAKSLFISDIPGQEEAERR